MAPTATGSKARWAGAGPQRAASRGGGISCSLAHSLYDCAVNSGERQCNCNDSWMSLTIFGNKIQIPSINLPRYFLLPIYRTTLITTPLGHEESTSLSANSARKLCDNFAGASVGLVTYAYETNCVADAFINSTKKQGATGQSGL